MRIMQVASNQNGKYIPVHGSVTGKLLLHVEL
jgi:hypothetical protein